MSGDNQVKKTWRPLQKLGNLKVAIARALSEDLRGLRKPAAIIAGDLGCHENTARNYLSATTELSASSAAELAKNPRYRTLRTLLREAIIPADTTLDEDLEQLRILQARVEARIREELTHVRPDLSMAGSLPQALIDRSAARCGRDDGQSRIPPRQG
jgi:predicted transcriptional regulator